MIKILSVLVSASSLVILSHLFGSQSLIKLDAELPGTIRPGDSFHMEVHVNKGSLTGYGKLQLSLPPNFNAEAIDLQGGQLSYEGKAIQVIWIKMPAEPSFSIALNIQSGSDFQGTTHLGGTFSYLKSDKPETVSLKEYAISSAEDREANQGKTKPHVNRRLLALSKSKAEYRVELTFQHQLRDIPARFVDQLPSGFKATLIEAHGGDFNVRDQSVTFKWAKFPTDTVFTISYAVQSVNNSSTPEISGLLLYGDEIPATEEIPVRSESVTDIKTVSLPSNPSTQTESGLLSSSTAPDILRMPDPEHGIFFKIQIAATMKSPSLSQDWFSSHFNIQDRVDVTFHNGWKKYVIGGFKNYPEASVFNRRTREKVNGSFVVAYEDGRRIPVQTALHNTPLNQ